MKHVNPTIKFHLLHPIKLIGRNVLRKNLFLLFQEEHQTLISLDYIFCTDDYLLQMNQAYLKHDTLTDVITFNLSDNRPGIIGEVYISAERAKENASAFGVTFQSELKRVIVHGALHLCGQEDKKPTDKAKMTERENYYLSKFG